MRFFRGIPFPWIGNPINFLDKHDKVIIGSVFQPFLRFGCEKSLFVLWKIFNTTKVVSDEKYQAIVNAQFECNWTNGNFEAVYYSRQDRSFIGKNSMVYNLMFRRGITSFYDFLSSDKVYIAGVGYSPFLDMWFGWNVDASKIKGFKVGDSITDQSGTFVARNMRDAKHLARQFSRSVR